MVKKLVIIIFFTKIKEVMIKVWIFRWSICRFEDVITYVVLRGWLRVNNFVPVKQTLSINKYHVVLSLTSYAIFSKVACVVSEYKQKDKRTFFSRISTFYCLEWKDLSTNLLAIYSIRSIEVVSITVHRPRACIIHYSY